MGGAWCALGRAVMGVWLGGMGGSAWKRCAQYSLLGMSPHLQQESFENAECCWNFKRTLHFL